MFRLFGSKSAARKSVDYWKGFLSQKPVWQLENIVRNPGEFVIEMREAASQLLEQPNNGTVQD